MTASSLTPSFKTPNLDPPGTRETRLSTIKHSSPVDPAFCTSDEGSTYIKWQRTASFFSSCSSVECACTGGQPGPHKVRINRLFACQPARRMPSDCPTSYSLPYGATQEPVTEPCGPLWSRSSCAAECLPNVIEFPWHSGHKQLVTLHILTTKPWRGPMISH